jgi:hypothetical protein
VTVTNLITALQIFAKYMKRGLETPYFFAAEHDIIYVFVDSGALPADTEDGRLLTELGWRIGDSDNWEHFV